MTTFEQPQPVENINFVPPTTKESQARAFREFRSREVLLKSLLTTDPAERAIASDRITQLLRKWAKECYPSETAGTVPLTGDNEIVSGVSSPLNNSNVLVTPSLSPFNSPLFTDGSGSASASSYAPSPNIHKYTSEDDVNTNVGENLGENVNQEEFQRNGFPDGQSDLSRRNSTDENSADNTEKSDDDQKKELVRLLALAVLRMSIDCPFADVRYSFNKCLKRLRQMNVPVPSPINMSPSFYIAPGDIMTLEWPSEYTDSSITRSTPRSITPTGCSSSCSSSSSNSTSFSEEVPRVIQQPLTPATPFDLASTPGLPPVGRQPDDMVKQMMIDTFIKFGRLSHLYRILAYFPSFMEKYQSCYNNIIRNPNFSPIPLSWRFYIGIMAASQYKCQYVVSKLTNDFLLERGDIDWLQGLHNAPAKIRNLATLNTILAHQPWRLQPSHIHALIKGSQDPRENWATAEVVHIILILSTFHSLSSFALGCGIVPEYDSVGGNCEQLLPCTPTTPIEESGNSIGILNEEISSEIATGLGVKFEQSGESETTTESVKASEPIPIPNPNRKNSLTVERVDMEIKHTSQLLKRLNLRTKDEDINNFSVSSEDSYSLSKAHEDSYSLSRIEFDNVDNVDEETFTDDTDMPSPFPFSQEFFSNTPRTSALAQPTYNPPPTEDFSRFLDPSVEISHADFAINSSEYKVFKLQDYCWETQGVSMVNLYFENTGEALDQEFAEIRDLTDYSLFHSYKSSSNIDLDTTPLRQAIWYYVQRLSGLFQDDYEYRQINTFLNKKIKAFLRKVCCTPEDIRYSDWTVVGFRLREEEKCHVNLIAVEARKQAELIYGLSCVMRYQKERRNDGDGSQ